MVAAERRFAAGARPSDERERLVLNRMAGNYHIRVSTRTPDRLDAGLLGAPEPWLYTPLQSSVWAQLVAEWIVLFQPMVCELSV